MKRSTGCVEPKSPIGTLSRGLYLLECVAYLGGSVRLTELADIAGLDKGTTHRLAGKLIQLGYLNRDAGGLMSVGLRVLNLGFALLASLDLRAQALPEMRELLADLDFSIQLCVLDGTEIVCLERLQCKRLQPIVPVGIGARMPAYCTAGGKAILAHLSPSTLEAILAQIDFRIFTRRTLSDPTALLADLKLTAKRGFAQADQEHLEGFRSVGAPLFDHTGSCVACISAGTFERQKSFAYFRDAIGPRLAQSARRISTQLGQRDPIAAMS